MAGGPSGSVSRAFGGVLREARARVGLTQDALAHHADVHRTYVGMVERGEKSPTLVVMLRLAAALKMPLSRLVAEAEARVAAAGK